MSFHDLIALSLLVLSNIPLGFSRWLSGKESTCQCKRCGFNPARYAGVGSGNPLQYSCLKNPMGRETWWATVHAVAKESRKNLPAKQQQLLTFRLVCPHCTSGIWTWVQQQYCFCSFFKYELHTFIWVYFWALYSISLICVYSLANHHTVLPIVKLQ